MTLLVCLNHDILSLIALNLLLPIIERNGWQFSIAITKTVGKGVISDITAIEKIIPFEGILPTLEHLNITGQYLTFKQIVEKYDCNFYEVKTINNDFGHGLIETHDLVVSVRFGSIFKATAINKARKSIINLHSAILPDYRGILGTFRALSDKQETIGATIHTISDGTIDTGDIVEIIKFKADYHATLFDNLLTLYQKTVPALAEIIEKISNHTHLDTVKQDTTQGHYFSNPTLDEIDAFKQNIMPIYNGGDVEKVIEMFLRFF